MRELGEIFRTPAGWSKRSPPSFVAREASFVSRFRTGCGMFARYASRFTNREAMRDKARGLFNILLATVADKSSASLLQGPRLVDDFVFGVKPVLKGGPMPMSSLHIELIGSLRDQAMQILAVRRRRLRPGRLLLRRER